MEGKNQQITDRKRLAHVQVYEKLYKMLMDGTFPVGTRLPSEPKLSKMLGVSRMTLRQALDLLHDDGLLQKVQGAGNFVMDRNKPVVSSLEKIGHPIYKCSLVQFDKVETEIKLEPANDFERELLNIETAVVIAIHTWYWSEGCLIAYTFGVMAVESVSKYHIDLNKKEEVVEFIQKGIYESASRTQLHIHPDSAGNSIQEEWSKNGQHATMIMEKIFDEELRPIICNKHYIVTEKAKFEINTK